MARDQNGRELAVGDVVNVRCVVRAVSPSTLDPSRDVVTLGTAVPAWEGVTCQTLVRCFGSQVQWVESPATPEESR